MLNDDERQAAEAIHASFRAKAQRIADNPGLSVLGRRADLARAAQAARDQLTALRGQADARRAAERARAERVLFAGTPATTLSDRDARAYASQIATPADARRELAAAERADDQSLCRAIFATAFDRIGPGDLGNHWAAVADTYLATRPRAAEAAHQLMDLRDSTRTAIVDAAMLRLALPQEIAGGTLEQHVAAGEPQDGVA
jgi:hypothetical protein